VHDVSPDEAPAGGRDPADAIAAAMLRGRRSIARRGTIRGRAERLASDGGALAAEAERDALEAHLKALERRRAEIVSEALRLAADNPRGRELGARVERLVDDLISLDLRPAPTAPAPDAQPVGPAPAAAPMAAVIVVEGDGPQTRRALLQLAGRTPRLAGVHVVGAAPGAPLDGLREVVGALDGWHLLTGPETTRGGGSLALTAALERSQTEHVALISSRCLVSGGWHDELAAVLDAGEGLAAAVPVTGAGAGPTALALPHDHQLDADGTALLLAYTAVTPPPAGADVRSRCWLLRRSALDAVREAAAGAPAGAVLDGLAGTLIRAGLHFAIAPRAYVELLAEPGDPSSAPAPAPFAGAWLRAAEDLAIRVASEPAALGAAIGRTAAPAPVLYLAPEHGPDRAEAERDVRGLMACGLPARVVTAREPLEEVLAREARGGDEVIVAAGPGVSSALGAAGARAVCLLRSPDAGAAVPAEARVIAVPAATWAGLGPGRDRAVAVSPVIDDALFRVLPDEAAQTAAIGVLVCTGAEPGEAPAHAVAALSGALGERGWVRTEVVDAVDGPALARVLNTADLVVDLTGGAGCELALAAMACGAVPVVAEGGPAEEAVAGAGLLIAPDALAGEGWPPAVLELAGDWPRLQAARVLGLAGARRHGLAAAGASRYAALRRLAPRP